MKLISKGKSELKSKKWKLTDSIHILWKFRRSRRTNQTNRRGRWNSSNETLTTSMVLILRNSRRLIDSELDNAPVRSKQRSRYYDNGRGRLKWLWRRLRRDWRNWSGEVVIGGGRIFMEEEIWIQLWFRRSNFWSTAVESLTMTVRSGQREREREKFGKKNMSDYFFLIDAFLLIINK
jgi:hypothetical protein